MSSCGAVPARLQVFLDVWDATCGNLVSLDPFKLSSQPDQFGSKIDVGTWRNKARSHLAKSQDQEPITT
jgi:hypothetical protein